MTPGVSMLQVSSHLWIRKIMGSDGSSLVFTHIWPLNSFITSRKRLYTSG